MSERAAGPRVAIVSPYPVLRAGMRSLLADEGIAVASEAATVADAARAGRLDGVDVVLLDPGTVGVDDIVESLADWPALRPLVLGPIAEVERLAVGLHGRAWGYATREASADLLASALRAVATGLVAIEATLSERLLTPLPASRTADSPEPVEELTRRESEVLELVAAGLANKMIANRLKISEHTVKFHVAAILAKLGAASRTEAGYIAARRGLIAL